MLLKIDADKRNQVKEITLDMAGSMQKIAKRCFPRAMQVVDRFHVSKLVYEAVQKLRIAYRWQVMKDENKRIKEAKAKGECYEPEVFSNGDTLRQLLARSRYLLFKAPEKWLQSQKVRAKILFEQFPDIKSVYYYALRLGKIFSDYTNNDVSKFLKHLRAGIENMLEGEMDAHLGYEKNSVSGHNSGNSRNGSYPKKIQTEHGEAVIPIPRDRNGEFEPIVVPKHESRGLSIEKLVISLYAKGMSVSDIEDEMREIYKIEPSTSAISIITNKVSQAA